MKSATLEMTILLRIHRRAVPSNPSRSYTFSKHKTASKILESMTLSNIMSTTASTTIGESKWREPINTRHTCRHSEIPGNSCRPWDSHVELTTIAKYLLELTSRDVLAVYSARHRAGSLSRQFAATEMNVIHQGEGIKPETLEWVSQTVIAPKKTYLSASVFTTVN